MRWLGLVAVVCVACIDSSSVTCLDGSVCPSGTICAAVTQPDETLCVAQPQLDACHGIADHVACHTDAIATGRCYDGVCLATVCGNGRVDLPDPNVPGDLGERCDDHNNLAGDGCSADCSSDESCGNGVLDGVTFEQCDDGNHLDHDGCNSSCTPEVPRWHQLAIDQITPRTTSMVFDTERGEAVLFGGSLLAGAVLSNDTWLWNGVGWSAASPASAPSPRAGQAMAYDSNRHRVVLFGGADASLELGDTWEWDGEVWTQVGAPTAPLGRRGAAMAYDPVRKKIVLFGGSHQLGMNSFYFNDTWEYDGTAWSQVTVASPPALRAGAAMAFDPIRGKIVMYGGGGALTIYGDTYDYDGASWTLKTPTQAPPGRFGAGFAWDASSASLVLFGGNTGGGDSTETWLWNGVTWARQTPVGIPPNARSFHAMTFDAARHQVVIFGGTNDDPATTWTWRSNTWTNLGPRPPAPQSQGQVAVDADHGRAVMVDDANLTWQSDGRSWTYTASVPSPTRDFAALAYDSARHETILFGGTPTNGTGGYADTWSWNGATWTHRTPAMSPSARTAVMAFDSARSKLILFGGVVDPLGTPVVALDETWAWDGATWLQLAPAHVPPKRFEHAMAYDPIRGQLVLFGGTSLGSDELADTWTWDGTDWTMQHPTHSPQARHRAAMVWNASRGRVMLYGGSDNTGDAWEWDGADWSLIAAGTTPHVRSRHAMFPAADGGGVVVFGGLGPSAGGPPQPLDDVWELRWIGARGGESCASTNDLDGDHLGGCADPDCWYRCTPDCPPNATCPASAPACGDAVCNAALENCHNCTADCGVCVPICGDDSCDAPETHASCPGDCP